MNMCTSRLQELLQAYKSRDMDAGAFVEQVFSVLGASRGDRLSKPEIRYIHDILDMIRKEGLAPAEACVQARELFPQPGKDIPTVDEFTE